MKNINIQCYFDERKNLTEEEKNNLKRKLLYSKKSVIFLVYRFIETLEKDKNINLNLVDLEIIIDDFRIKSTVDPLYLPL